MKKFNTYQTNMYLSKLFDSRQFTRETLTNGKHFTYIGKAKFAIECDPESLDGTNLYACIYEIEGSGCENYTPFFEKSEDAFEFALEAGAIESTVKVIEEILWRGSDLDPIDEEIVLKQETVYRVDDVKNYAPRHTKLLYSKKAAEEYAMLRAAIAAKDYYVVMDYGRFHKHPMLSIVLTEFLYALEDDIETDDFKLTDAERQLVICFLDHLVKTGFTKVSNDGTYYFYYDNRCFETISVS